jgi:hypothetical protein
LVWAEKAAEKPTHAERMNWIDENVPENFRALVRDLMCNCLAPYVLALPTVEERRAYIQDIPLDADPPWARSLVECMVKDMWRNRKRYALVDRKLKA